MSGTRGRRAGAAEKRLARKVERVRASSHPGGDGRTIKQMVQDQLDDAMRDWQGMVDEGWGKGDPQRATARGKVRGLAVALATLLSPHAPNARGVERESLARVKDEDGTQ